MTTTCCFCRGYISGQGEPISHGLHVHCGMIVYAGYQRPALPPSSSIIPDILPTDTDAKIQSLMMPKATRFDDCIHCHYRDLDGDGVPDGCGAPGNTCIAPGRRSPWVC